MRVALGILAVLALAACRDGVGPPVRPSAGSIRIAYLDGAGSTLRIVEVGMSPSVTAIQGAIPFAALHDGIVLVRQGGLSLYYLDGSSLTVPAVIGSGSTGGAVSPDGERLAYSSSGAGTDVYLHLLRLADGDHDSIRVSGRDDVPAAVQILGRRPVWSPSGDSVAFLLPNPIGLQLFLYEVPTRRIEAYAVPVPVTTYARPLDGWPYWHPDGSLHFVARQHDSGILSDTLLVMRIFPRMRDRNAELVYAAYTDSVVIANATSYSFSSDGRAVGLSLESGGRLSIALMRRDVPTITPIELGAQAAPVQPLIIP